MTTADIRDLIAAAYEQGCVDTHENYEPDPDPSFGEAASDYAASVTPPALDAQATTPPATPSTPVSGLSGGAALALCDLISVHCTGEYLATPLRIDLIRRARATLATLTCAPAREVDNDHAEARVYTALRYGHAERLGHPVGLASDPLATKEWMRRRNLATRGGA